MTRPVAVVHPYAWPEVRRGGERYAHDLVRYLRGAGWTVDSIAGTAGRGSTMPGDGGDDIRLHHLPALRRGRVRLGDVETVGLRLLPTLVRRRYAVVHSMIPSGVLAARASGHRAVFTLLGAPNRDQLDRRPWQRRLLRAALDAADTVTVLSEAVADSVEEAFGLRPRVVPPGIWTDDFAPAPRAPNPTILFASAMRPEKGLDVLLGAFGALADTHPDSRLVLCGPGDPAWAFDALGPAAARVRASVDVVGPGRIEELPGRYAAAHVTVLPSRNEAFGLVLVESLAAGTPVVASVGGSSDVVVPDVGGLVDFGDVDGLVAELERALALAADPSTASTCRAHAMRWDWAGAVGPMHAALYEPWS